MTDHDSLPTDRVNLANAILEGEFDADLQAIHGALNKRQAMLRRIESASIISSVNPGDAVKLARIWPKYMEGALASVIEKSGPSRLLVQLSQSKRRFAAGSLVTVHASCVERVATDSGSAANHSNRSKSWR